MDWSKEDIAYLRSFRNVVDSDNIKIKKNIKKKLVDNKYIVHVLHNKELEESDAEPDEYFGVNILPYYIIAPVQTKVQHFICYETHFKEINNYNKIVKVQQLYFYILCHNKDIIDAETSLARHDLLAALITDEFNWTNIFGSKIHLVSDQASVTDNDYATRTLICD